MIETPISKTQTVSEMILAELALSVESLTSGDLYERLELDHADTVIHRAIGLLLRDGRIELDAPRLGKRGQPSKTYRLPRSDATRLMEHLESELAGSTTGDESPTAADPDPIAPRCTACGGLLEHPETTTCLECQIDTAEHETDAKPHVSLAPPTDDPILRALARMDAQDPRWEEGQIHVERIRAMATHLDEGRAIVPQMDVIAYLYDLANTIEAMIP